MAVIAVRLIYLKGKLEERAFIHLRFDLYLATEQLNDHFCNAKTESYTLGVLLSGSLHSGEKLEQICLLVLCHAAPVIFDTYLNKLISTFNYLAINVNVPISFSELDRVRHQVDHNLL